MLRKALVLGIPALLVVLPAVGCRQTQATPPKYPTTGFTATPSVDIYPPPGGGGYGIGTYPRSARGAGTADQWVCPMHPTVKMPQPGRCSICGMDLVHASELADAEKNDVDKKSSPESGHLHSPGSGHSHPSGSGGGCCG